MKNILFFFHAEQCTVCKIFVRYITLTWTLRQTPSYRPSIGNDFTLTPGFTGQRLHWSETSLVRDFTGQRLHWSEASLVRDTLFSTVPFTLPR